MSRNEARWPDTRHPCWAGYRRLLDVLKKAEFPGIDDLNSLLPPGLTNQAGEPIHFVPAGRLPGVAYEQHIFETGEVSTRENNWHDLFNALVWCRWPELKSAMNTMHRRHIRSEDGGRRGRVRDALTLFDECGVIVISSHQDILLKLARREWQTVFRAPTEFGVRITGHALLEKFMAPYKSITAQALLLDIGREGHDLKEDAFFRALDRVLADRLLSGRLFMAPEDLSPLPLMGLPGWWPDLQDEGFYADPTVFRSPPDGFLPAPVFRL